MSFDPEKITFFAKTDARGQHVTFGIKAKDRQRHMYVVGKTGMGKSTLLENMAVQDIQNGEGMAFIDPHGSAAELLLEYIPEHRINDVVYFAPFDLENPISFNVMEDVGQDKRHLVVSGLMSTFKKIWVDAWSARMEYILTNALLVLIEYPDTTLLSVNRIFNDKAYRLKVVDYCTDPAVKSFWVDEFANYTERFAAEALPAIQNKIGQFTGNPLIRNIIGQPHSSFDFRKCMDEKKIVIMNLSKGLVGETNANLLGSMLTTRIYLAAMSRANLPIAQMKVMPNFYFYVDEFQSFANATFANILSEARKYHLNLIIAHQYIEQMEEEVRDAVFGNVGTTISFRVGPFDAETLETVFTPRFLAADLVNLGFAQIYLTMMIDGIGSQPFSAVTLPPITPPTISCKDMVIAASRHNFTKPRLEVEKIVTDLHTPEKIEKKTPPPKQSYQKPKTDNSSNPNPSSNSNNVRPVTNEDTSVKTTETKPPVPIAGQAQAPVATAVTTEIRKVENQNPPYKPADNKTDNSGVKTEERNERSKPVVVERGHDVARKQVTNQGANKNQSREAGSSFNSRQNKNQEPGRNLNSNPSSNFRQKNRPVQESTKTATQKSEDLRSILAKIADSSKTDKNKLSENSATLRESDKDIDRARESTTFKKIDTALSPLQAALAELKKVDTAKVMRNLPPRPFPLPTSFTPASVIIKTEAELLHSEIESVFASLDNKLSQKTSTAEIGQAEVTAPRADVMVAEKPKSATRESAPAMKPSDQTLTSSEVKRNNLDSKEIAKILRAGAPEKSPFR